MHTEKPPARAIVPATTSELLARSMSTRRWHRVSRLTGNVSRARRAARATGAPARVSVASAMLHRTEWVRALRAQQARRPHKRARARATCATRGATAMRRALRVACRAHRAASPLSATAHRARHGSFARRAPDALAAAQRARIASVCRASPASPSRWKRMDSLASSQVSARSTRWRRRRRRRR